MPWWQILKQGSKLAKNTNGSVAFTMGCQCHICIAGMLFEITTNPMPRMVQILQTIAVSVSIVAIHSAPS